MVRHLTFTSTSSPRFPSDQRAQGGLFFGHGEALVQEGSADLFALSIILYLHRTVNPHTTFVHKLKDLFAAHPNVDPAAMGFPKGWEAEPLWK